jgi:four helix bundle protein
MASSCWQLAIRFPLIMKTFRFRDFTIYQEARLFRQLVRTNLQLFPQEERFRLIDQIHRSALSIMLNIAEGSAKGTDKDFARFLRMAIGSVNEVMAGFDAAVDDEIVTQEQSIVIENAAEKLAKQIGSFIKTLSKPIANCQLPIARA